VIKHVFQAQPSLSSVMTLTASLCLFRFDIIKKLGQGTYGKVQLGINKETGQEVAIKTIKKSKIETEADLIRIRREVQIMSSVQHPNIIHIYEGEFLLLLSSLLDFVCLWREASSREKLFNFP
jgi:serine/threonine protein kinase